MSNGHSIPVVSCDTSILPTADMTLYLNHVLIAPDIVRNFLSVSQFTRDNRCSIEFDAFGFSVKDPWMGRMILRCYWRSLHHTIHITTHHHQLQH
jgi:hypothetical protein